jgi:subtilisin family serine protease
MNRLLVAFALSLSVVLVGCDSEMTPTSSTSPQQTDAVASSSDANSTDASTMVQDRYIVVQNGTSEVLEKRVESMGGTVLYQHSSGFALVDGLSERDADRISSMQQVQQVQQDAVMSLGEPETVEALDASTASVDAGAVTESVEDPSGARFFAVQWNLRAIGAPTAWENDALGSEDVSVAILDTGIDVRHPDMQGRVDLERSVSFLPSDDERVRELYPDRHLITDLNWHGTHMASQVASSGAVLSGVTSKTTLMGVKVCNISGDCPTGAVLAGILYAVENGADAINLSLGGYDQRSDLQRLNGVINSTINQAKKAGVPVVASAGNRGQDLDQAKNLYKTYCDTPNVICVSATGPTSSDNLVFGPWENVDAVAPYTNYGRSAIDVAAPGGSFEGLIFGSCPLTSQVYDFCRSAPTGVGVFGTSNSAAHVTGVVAQVLAEQGGNAAQVRSTIFNAARDLGESGKDPFYGRGFVDVPRSLGLQ